MRIGAPVIGLNDSGGARIQEGVESLAGYADIFLRNTLASGVVPQISAIMGPCAGGAVYSPAITDFILMVERDELHVHHRPRGHQGGDERGGRQGDPRRRRDAREQERRLPPHRARRSRRASPGVRELLSFLPSNNTEDPPRPPRERPGRPRGARARHDGARRLDASPTTSATSCAPWSTTRTSSRSTSATRRTSSCGFARIGGRPVGVVANQPQVLAGLPRHQGQHQGRALRPLLRLLQHPARAPSSTSPASSPAPTRSTAASSRTARSCSTRSPRRRCPKITVITRKAYGGAYDVMASKHIRADYNFAFPTAEIAVMGPEGAVNIVYRKEIQAAADPAAGPRALRRGVQGQVREPVQGRGARLHRRGDLPAPAPHPPRRARSSSSATSATRTRRRSTATFRCDRVTRSARSSADVKRGGGPVR